MTKSKPGATFPDQVAAMTGQLRVMAMKYTKNYEQAKDLAADVQVQALLHEHQFEKGSNLKAWLYTITRNLFATQYQRQKKRGETLGYDAINEGWAGLPVCQNEALSLLEEAVIDDALTKLEPMDQVIMRGRVAGYKYHELAETAGIPIGTIKNRIHLNRKKLHCFMAHPSPGVLLKSAPRNLVFRAPEPQPVAEPIVSQQATPDRPGLLSKYERLLTYLLNTLSQVEFRRVDLQQAGETAGMGTLSLRIYSLPALLDLGALEINKIGVFNTYRRTNTFTDVSAKDFKLAVKKRNEATTKPVVEAAKSAAERCGLPASQEELEEAVANWRRSEQEQQSTVVMVTADQCVSLSNNEPAVPELVPLPPAIPAPNQTQYGFCGEGGLIWFDTYEEAAGQAKKYLAGDLPQISIVSKVGLVKIEIVEIRY